MERQHLVFAQLFSTKVQHTLKAASQGASLTYVVAPREPIPALWTNSTSILSMLCRDLPDTRHDNAGRALPRWHTDTHAIRASRRALPPPATFTPHPYPKPPIPNTSETTPTPSPEHSPCRCSLSLGQHVAILHVLLVRQPHLQQHPLGHNVLSTSCQARVSNKLPELSKPTQEGLPGWEKWHALQPMGQAERKRESTHSHRDPSCMLHMLHMRWVGVPYLSNVWFRGSPRVT